MTLLDLLERIREPYAANPTATVRYATLAGGPENYSIEGVTPIAGARFGTDEVLIEMVDPPRTHPTTAGALLAQLLELAKEHANDPVEICEPTIEIGNGMTVRIDHPLYTTGENVEDRSFYLFGLPMDPVG